MLPFLNALSFFLGRSTDSSSSFAGFTLTFLFSRDALHRLRVKSSQSFYEQTFYFFLLFKEVPESGYSYRAVMISFSSEEQAAS